MVVMTTKDLKNKIEALKSILSNSKFYDGKLEEFYQQISAEKIQKLETELAVIETQIEALSSDLDDLEESLKDEPETELV
jgi:prefoldin subunit 5